MNGGRGFGSGRRGGQSPSQFPSPRPENLIRDHVFTAQRKDNNGEIQEAYLEYLGALNLIARELYKVHPILSGADMGDQSESVRTLAKMGVLCLERTRDLFLATVAPPPERKSDVVRMTGNASVANLQSVGSASPKGATSRPRDVQRVTLPVIQAPQKPADGLFPVSTEVGQRFVDMESSAARENLILERQYRERMRRAQKQGDAARYAALRLDLMRKTVENKALARRHQKILIESVGQRQKSMQMKLRALEKQGKKLRLFDQTFSQLESRVQAERVRETVRSILQDPSHSASQPFFDGLRTLTGTYSKNSVPRESVIADVRKLLEDVYNHIVSHYLELSSEEMRSATLLSIEEVVFPHVVNLCLGLYVQRNYEKDQLLIGRVQSDFARCGPWDFNVRQTFWLATPGVPCEPGYVPYASAMSALHRVTDPTSPERKLAAVVYTSNEIIRCVRDFWGDRLPAEELLLGADDLLPIFSYVVGKAGVPGLFAQIEFLSDFVNHILMMKEEGYALATLQTAAEQCLSPSVTVQRTDLDEEEVHTLSDAEALSRTRPSEAGAVSKGNDEETGEVSQEMRYLLEPTSKGDSVVDDLAQRMAFLRASIDLPSTMPEQEGMKPDIEPVDDLAKTLQSIASVQQDRDEQDQTEDGILDDLEKRLCSLRGTGTAASDGNVESEKEESEEGSSDDDDDRGIPDGQYHTQGILPNSSYAPAVLDPFPDEGRGIDIAEHLRRASQRLNELQDKNKDTPNDDDDFSSLFPSVPTHPPRRK